MHQCLQIGRSEWSWAMRHGHLAQRPAYQPRAARHSLTIRLPRRPKGLSAPKFWNTSVGIDNRQEPAAASGVTVGAARVGPSSCRLSMPTLLGED